GVPDVQPLALPDPGVHVRHALDVPVLGRTRRANVHALDLAAGHLAAPARLRLHRDAAVGRDLHAPADDRDALRRADVRLPLRPLPRPPVRDGRDAPDRARLRAAAPAADELLLS